MEKSVHDTAWDEFIAKRRKSRRARIRLLTVILLAAIIVGLSFLIIFLKVPFERTYDALCWKNFEEEPEEPAQLTLSGRKNLLGAFVGTLTITLEEQPPVVLDVSIIRESGYKNSWVLCSNEILGPRPDSFRSAEARVANVFWNVSNDEVAFVFWLWPDGASYLSAYDDQRGLVYTAPAASRQEALNVLFRLLSRTDNAYADGTWQ